MGHDEMMGKGKDDAMGYEEMKDKGEAMGHAEISEGEDCLRSPATGWLRENDYDVLRAD